MSSLPHPLGRHVEFDDQSKRYRLAPILPLLAPPEPRSKIWPIRQFMNQGLPLDVVGWDPSSCTGFSRAHACNAEPQIMDIDQRSAYAIYERARYLDEWPGEAYEGSSVLAAAKAGQELGYVGSYWWALTYEEFVSSIGWVGPGVVGSIWTQGMFDSDERGFIYPTGANVGGHAYCIGGISLELDAAIIYQSWGPVTNITDETVLLELSNLGMTLDQMEFIQLITLNELWELLQDRGEYCVSLDRVDIEPLPDPEVKPGCNLLRTSLRKLRRR